MQNMKRVVLAAALILSTGPVLAQTPPATPSAVDAPAKATSPVPGANSFTESQAKARMESAGVSEVANLRKDEQGIWRAYAKQGGKQVNVALDFRGNVIVTQ